MNSCIVIAFVSATLLACAAEAPPPNVPSTTAAPSAPAAKQGAACARAGGMCQSKTSPQMNACGAAPSASEDCDADSFCCMTGSAKP